MRKLALSLLVLLSSPATAQVPIMMAPLNNVPTPIAGYADTVPPVPMADPVYDASSSQGRWQSYPDPADDASTQPPSQNQQVASEALRNMLISVGN